VPPYLTNYLGLHKLESEMKIGVVLALTIILVLALLVLFYATGSVLGISATELTGGVKVDNVGNIDCLVFVNSVEGNQRFELPIGQTIVVLNITKPIQVSAVTK